VPRQLARRHWVKHCNRHGQPVNPGESPVCASEPILHCNKAMKRSSISKQFGEPRSAFVRSMYAALRRPTTYALMTTGILFLDFLTGQYHMFPILFVVPVACAAWFYSAHWAYGLAVVLPGGRFCVAAFVENPFPRQEVRRGECAPGREWSWKEALLYGRHGLHNVACCLCGTTFLRAACRS
jgi:hypothetical protein